MLLEDKFRKARILIVDDQKLHTFFLEKLLKKEGYESIMCLNDTKNISNVMKNYKPDLLVLDLLMPGIDSFQIIKQLKEQRKDNFLPILALSPEKDAESHHKALNSGATDFINIPFEDTEVLFRIRNMIESSLLHLEIRNQNQILEMKVQERTKELHDTRLEIIRRLAQAAEYRDNDTGAHIIRMSHYCARFGKTLGFSETQCNLLLNASPLHDVGKIGIPDSILLKPGKLTDEEFEIMKTHTTIGAEILSGSPSPLMKMAQTIALTHHEKWDGTGYPNKLKGDNIPLVGQICSVCDVFDALTSKRPYKRAWSVEEAVIEMKNMKNKHFNPHLIDQFENILPDIRKIKEEHVE